MATDTLTVIPGMEDMISAQRPEGADEGLLGNEHIGRDDILVPRLALAQKTSPEIDPTQVARYIDGLQFTDLFNSISRVNYGKGPLYFVILRADPPRWIEFIPLDQGGGVRDPNVPANDIRTKFGEIDPLTKKSAKPIATKFYDFFILLLNGLDFQEPMTNVMALSMKSSAIKTAKQLNLLINQRGKKAIYKGVYKLESSSDADGNKTWAIYKVQNHGWVKPGSAVEALAAEMHESWKDRKVEVDLETDAHDDAGDTSFDTEKMENEATHEGKRGDM